MSDQRHHAGLSWRGLPVGSVSVSGPLTWSQATLTTNTQDADVSRLRPTVPLKACGSLSSSLGAMIPDPLIQHSPGLCGGVITRINCISHQGLCEAGSNATFCYSVTSCSPTYFLLGMNGTQGTSGSGVAGAIRELREEELP